MLDMCIGMPQLQPVTDVNHIILNSVQFTPDCLIEPTSNHSSSDVHAATDKGVGQISSTYESHMLNMKTREKQHKMMSQYRNTYDMLSKQYRDYFQNLHNNSDVGKEQKMSVAPESVGFNTNSKVMQNSCDCPICGYKCLYESIYHQHMLNHAQNS
ncbi:unnamed protein product, partial [Meganyctiphanes norvegica]